MSGALSLLLLSGCGGGAELVVALKPDKDPDAMLEQRDALEKYLEGELGMAVTVVVPTSGTVIEEGLANGTVDLAWVSSTSLARYRERGAAELLLAGEVDGRTWYESYWIALADSGLTSLESLAGQAVCFASPTSTSGYVIPMYDLYQQGKIDAASGAEGYFGEGNVHFGTGYVSAVMRVLDGGVEAAAVSDYVMDSERYLNAGQRERLKVVARQGPVPTHVMAVRSALDGDLAERLEGLLLTMSAEHPELTLRLFGGPLLRVDADAHLAPIERALAFVRELR